MRSRSLVGLTAVLVAFVPVLVSAAPAAAAPTPAWSHTYGGWNRSSSPVIADVNGDGRNDIVHGHQDGMVRVLDAATGNNLPGWPQPNAVRPPVATAIDGSPAVGDIDRDGTNEVIVPGGSTWKSNQAGGVVVFRRDGSVKCRFETRDAGNVWANTAGPDGYPDGVYSTPALGDVDGDSYPDIVFGAWDLYVHAIDRNCNELSGFPVNVEDSTWSSPALYDSDNDGRLEIFIGGDQMAGGHINWSGGEFRALDWTDGTVRELWKRQTDDVIHSSPAIGDIDGDGRLEVVVGGGNFYNRGDGRKVFAWHLEDGSDVAGWPVTTLGATNSSPALGDVTGDGVPEVAIGSHDGILRVLRGNGQVYWQRRLRFNDGPGNAIGASPIVADMNGDGRNDVGVGNDWGFFIVDGPSGNEITSVNEWKSFEAAGAFGDFGSLGWRLVVSGFDTPGNSTTIQSYSLAAPGVAPPWPMFHRTASHIGAPDSGGDPLPPGFCARGSNPAPNPSPASSNGYWILGVDGGLFAFNAPFFGSVSGQLAAGEQAVGMQSSPTGNGYYILTSKGRIFTFGDARSHGSMEGIPLNAPIIAIAPTPSGNGYWLLARDGGVFSFGDAVFWGSTGGIRLNEPIISMAPTRTGRGYWLLASDGGVFSFGDASFHGSTGGMRLAAPVVSMSTSPSGNGYWLIAKDGGVFSFGVPFYGSIPGTGICRSPLGMQLRATRTGGGYFVLAADGGVYSFGDAMFIGAAPGLGWLNYAVDMAVRP